MAKPKRYKPANLTYSPELLGSKDADCLVRWTLWEHTPRAILAHVQRVTGYSTRDLIQEVYKQLLQSKQPPRDLALSTVLYHKTRWVVFRMRDKLRISSAPPAETQWLPLDYAREQPATEPTPFDAILSVERRDRVTQALNTLTYRQRIILQCRYELGDGACYGQEQIGEILRVSRAWIQQIERKAIRMLQDKPRVTQLQPVAPAETRQQRATAAEYLATGPYGEAPTKEDIWRCWLAGCPK